MGNFVKWTMLVHRNIIPFCWNVFFFVYGHMQLVPYCSSYDNIIKKKFYEYPDTKMLIDNKICVPDIKSHRKRYADATDRSSAHISAFSMNKKKYMNERSTNQLNHRHFEWSNSIKIWIYDNFNAKQHYLQNISQET